VIATDIVLGMLKAACDFTAESGANNLIFEYADAEQLPFGDLMFDLVTCRVAAHHFCRGAQFFKESSRVLKTGGMLVVEDHVLPDDKDVAGCVERFEKMRDPSQNRAFSAN